MKQTNPLLQSTMRYVLAACPAFVLMARHLPEGVVPAALITAGAVINVELFLYFLDGSLVV